MDETLECVDQLPETMALADGQVKSIALEPPPPEDLYFSEVWKAWVASRYRDVLAALRSNDLVHAGPATADADSTTKARPANIRAEVLAAVLSSNNSKWQLDISRHASALLRTLPGDHAIDLVTYFIRPWCLASAMAMMSIDPAHSETLGDLVNWLLSADAAPDDVALRCRAREGNHNLDRFFGARSGLSESARGGSSKSTFLGIAQTVPMFLASAWAALLQHPHEMRELSAHPDRLNVAIEELLRYAGPVHTLFRRADKDTQICGTKIGCSERLILRVSSANRDAHQFPDPNRLRFFRDFAGHLALGSGPHYCAGGSLVRVMTAIATQTLLTRCSDVRLSGPVQWSCGNMLIWASSLPVVFGEAP